MGMVEEIELGVPDFPKKPSSVFWFLTFCELELDFFKAGGVDVAIGVGEEEEARILLLAII